MQAVIISWLQEMFDIKDFSEPYVQEAIEKKMLLIIQGLEILLEAKVLGVVEGGERPLCQCSRSCKTRGLETHDKQCLEFWST